MMKKRLLIVFPALCLLGCAPGNDYRITGTWEGGDGRVVYLQKATNNKKYETVDSTTVSKGAFLFSGKLKEIDRRQLVVGTAKRDILLDGVPVQVTVTSRMNTKTGEEIQSLAVTGSIEQTIIEEARTLMMGKGFMSLGSMLLMMEVKDDSVKLDSVYRSTELLKQSYERNLRGFLDTTSNSYAITYLIADFLIREYPFTEVEHYYDRLTPRVKNSYPGKLLREKIVELKRVNVGGIAPEIELPAPDGTTFKLSSLRGRYVLVDFWASWCGPCIAEVPNVKAVYDKYHDRGFEILGVSLDDKSDKWTAAIERHALGWHHVSSLQGWKCPVAALYNVTGIPKTFLLDTEGRIIAIDLRGEALGERVAEIFK
jgi:peroxiredoxin